MPYKLKLFADHLQSGVLMRGIMGPNPAHIRAFFHTAGGHTSVYVDPNGMETIKKCYLDNGVTLEWDAAENGYWATNVKRNDGYYDDQKPFIPLRSYRYRTDKGWKTLFCITDLAESLGFFFRESE